MAVRDPGVAPGNITRLAAVLTVPRPKARRAAGLDDRGPTAATLRASLVSLDVVAVSVAWSLALLQLKPGARPGAGLVAVVALIVPTSVAILAAQHLYRARVCSVRSVETEGLIRTALLSAGLAWAAGGWSGVTLHDAAVGAGLSFVLTRGLRSGFSSYLQAGRRKGRFGRPVVLVGANEEGDDLYRLLSQHPELGFHVVGFVGEAAGAPVPVPYLGRVEETAQALARTGATGVIVAATARGAGQLNRLTR